MSDPRDEDIERLLTQGAKMRGALMEIRDKAGDFDNHACLLYGGDSPQALWAHGLREFVETALREGMSDG